MKVTMTFDCELDGEVSDAAIAEAFLTTWPSSAIVSEEIDGSDNWAIVIRSQEVVIGQ